MMQQIEQYMIAFFDLPIVEKKLSYAPWLNGFTEDYPIEAGIILICLLIILTSMLYKMLFRNHSSSGNLIAPTMPKGLARKLANLPHPVLPLYKVDISKDMAGMIVEITDNSLRQSDLESYNIEASLDGLSSSATAMLDQLRHDGKLTD